MNTSKQSNYRWLLDAGHFGWDNERRQRMNCQGTVSRLAKMLERARIDFSQVLPTHRSMRFNKRNSIVKELCARNKRCVYLSLQIKNTIDKEPDLGVSAVIFGRDHVGVSRMRALLDHIYGPSLKTHTQEIDCQGMKAASVEDLRGLLKAKCPKILVTYYLPEGARYGIRKGVMRIMAQDLMKLIRSAEKQRPI